MFIYRHQNGDGGKGRHNCNISVMVEWLANLLHLMEVLGSYRSPIEDFYVVAKLSLILLVK